MSHDRGCPCGKEFYEYSDCTDSSCNRKPKQAMSPMRPDSETIRRQSENTKRDALVFIGRFQPFHNGHKAVIDAALEQAHEVVVVVGSSFQARNIRNPFTFQERKAMIEAVYPRGRTERTTRVKVVPVSDFPYDDNKWVNAIQRIVDDTVPNAKDIGLIGHSKDSTSYYLNIFPKWKNHVEVPNVDGINATDIRNIVLAGKWPENTLKSTMPVEAFRVMEKVIYVSEYGETTDAFDTLFTEYDMVKKYKKPYQKLSREDITTWLVSNNKSEDLTDLLDQFSREFRPQFPPTFMTVDAVVVQSGHILLVERGDMPGKGLWALPGGFLNQDETMLDGAIRELREETKIKVPVPVLKGSIKASKTFDAPNRSSRGRTITQAFFLDLGVGELPKVKGSDDAAKAFWVPFNEVKQEKMFEDHFHIIDNFINIG
jgi:bifunctional NMN adenylyltransferase/nudix hydrolase